MTNRTTSKRDWTSPDGCLVKLRMKHERRTRKKGAENEKGWTTKESDGRVGEKGEEEEEKRKRDKCCPPENWHAVGQHLLRIMDPTLETTHTLSDACSFSSRLNETKHLSGGAYLSLSIKFFQIWLIHLDVMNYKLTGPGNLHDYIPCLCNCVCMHNLQIHHVCIRLWTCVTVNVWGCIIQITCIKEHIWSVKMK